MVRYIDADKFLEDEIKRNGCVPLVGVSKYINGEECFEGEHLDTLIDKAPTAEVAEVKHGYWIPHKIMIRSPYARNYDCSECGNSPIECGAHCNKCGAIMDGGAE